MKEKIFLIIISVIGGLVLGNIFKNDSIEEVLIEEKTIKSEIKGAVGSPGVYELKPGSRVEDIVNLSGGLNKNANIDTINLSKVLNDEMVVIIYTNEEIESMRKGNTTIKYIENECICPVVENNACIGEIITNIDENTSKPNDFKISLNKATLEELMTIKGIGEKKAQAIIEYRKKTPFKNTEEITNISGIGKATYEKIKDNLTL